LEEFSGCIRIIARHLFAGYDDLVSPFRNPVNCTSTRPQAGPSVLFAPWVLAVAGVDNVNPQLNHVLLADEVVRPERPAVFCATARHGTLWNLA
jgi:hypothetical protein